MSDSPEAPSFRSVGDFASFLGLSRWTVSRILNGHGGVSEETRRRVLDEMARLNFQPNMMARSLRGAKTGLIGVCFQEIESPILARKISCLQDSLRARGLRGVMEITSGLVEAERDIIHHFVSLKVDGIILIGSKLEAGDGIFKRLFDESVPVVTVDAANPIPVARVELDRGMAMLLCLRHLQQRGHGAFALLGLASDPVYGTRRIEGLREAAAKLGMDWDSCFKSFHVKGRTDWSYGYGYALGQELLQLENPPRGVIALNDRVAIGAMKAIREWGYSIPSDFSVVGFDNLEIGQWTDPALTSIGQNVREMIEQAIKMVQTLVAAGSAAAPSLVTVQPKLIVRAST